MNIDFSKPIDIIIDENDNVIDRFKLGYASLNKSKLTGTTLSLKKMPIKKLIRTIKTQKEFDDLCEDVRGRKNEIDPVHIDFGDDMYNCLPYNWDIEYLEITKIQTV